MGGKDLEISNSDDTDFDQTDVFYNLLPKTKNRGLGDQILSYQLFFCHLLGTSYIVPV